MCFDNQLTSLDVSNNTALYRLWCNNNNLTSLNIANGNNTAMSGGLFKANNNSLTTITCDDPVYATNEYQVINSAGTVGSIDPGVTFVV